MLNDLDRSGVFLTISIVIAGLCLPLGAFLTLLILVDMWFAGRIINYECTINCIDEYSVQLNQAKTTHEFDLVAYSYSLFIESRK